MNSIILSITLYFLHLPNLNFQAMKTHDSEIIVEQYTLTSSLYFIGNDFFGSYENTSKNLDQLKREFKARNISFNELEAVSIYLSDPSLVQQSKLKAFHGFVTESFLKIESFVTKELPHGRYLLAKTKDPNHIWDMFGEAYKYGGQNNLTISQEPPVLITTVEQNAPLFTMYFAIE